MQIEAIPPLIRARWRLPNPTFKQMYILADLTMVELKGKEVHSTELR